jgi:hypothetical protein
MTTGPNGMKLSRKWLEIPHLSMLAFSVLSMLSRPFAR